MDAIKNGMDPSISFLFPFLPENIKIVTGLRDLSVTAGEDAHFMCEVSHDDYADGIWWLGSTILQKNEMNQMSCRGREHHLVLTKATAEEAGIVAFTAGNERTSARLRVQSKPKGEDNVVWSGVLQLGLQ